MGAYFSYALLAVAGMLAIPTAVLVTEVLAAVLFARRRKPTPPSELSRPRLAVLVPAHNESTGLLPTLADIESQLLPGDRLVVVADNCTDDTGAVAAAAGAEVVTRRDGEKVGKGYALDFGIRHLSSDPPPIILIFDADCRLRPDAVDRLASTCSRLGRPTQALYLMRAAAESSVNQRFAEFAWLIRNWVRPFGLRSLGLPCQLMGTGMAFPWGVISRSELANGHLVEDLKLGLDLARLGTPAAFCPAAVVTSEFAPTRKGAQSQRQRWEQGAIGTIVHTAVPLAVSAILRGNKGLLALALDATVPPLTLFALLIAATFAASAVVALIGLRFTPLALTSCTLAAFLFSVFLCWWNWGRKVLPSSTLASFLSYFLSKLRLYALMAAGNHATRWVRTERKTELMPKEHEGQY